MQAPSNREAMRDEATTGFDNSPSLCRFVKTPIPGCFGFTAGGGEKGGISLSLRGERNGPLLSHSCGEKRGKEETLLLFVQKTWAWKT